MCCTMSLHMYHIIVLVLVKLVHVIKSVVVCTVREAIHNTVNVSRAICILFYLDVYLSVSASLLLCVQKLKV